VLKLVDQLEDDESLKFVYKTVWKAVELSKEKFDENGMSCALICLRYMGVDYWGC
jgi:hypothetical protein